MKALIGFFLMIFPILTFSSEDICVVYDNMDRIEVNGEKVLDDSDYFGDECDGNVSCLLDIAKKMKELGICSRISFNKPYYSSKECVISSHYPRIKINDETIYDGGGWGAEFYSTIGLLELTSLLQTIDMCEEVYIR